MVELTPGSQVFIYQNLVQQAIAKTSYKAAASFLLNCFYTNDEMMGMNLSGANGKPYPDKHILGAIIGTVCKQTLKLLIITPWLVSAYDFYSRVVKDHVNEQVSLTILHNE